MRHMQLKSVINLSILISQYSIIVYHSPTFNVYYTKMAIDFIIRDMLLHSAILLSISTSVST